MREILRKHRYRRSYELAETMSQNSTTCRGAKYERETKLWGALCLTDSIDVPQFREGQLDFCAGWFSIAFNR